MPERPLTDLPHHLRERAATLRADFRQFREDVRNDPAVLWRTQPVRVAFLIVLGIALLLAARQASGLLLPAADELSAEQPTQTATVYVACGNPDCGACYQAHPPMDFRAWPLVCEKCGQPTAFRAAPCHECGAWHPDVGGEPPCLAARKAAPPPAAASAPTDPDDREDPW